MRAQARHKRSAGVVLLAILAFLLFAIPRANFRLGPIPVYVIDLVGVLVFVQFAIASAGASSRRNPFKFAVSLLILLIVAGELNGAVKSGSALESSYLLLRTLVAASMIFAIPALLTKIEDFVPVLKAMALGVLVTSSLMILTSLPQTRPLALELFFSNSFLEPASESISRYLTTRDPESGVRGTTLVGVSILGATFINLAYPFVIALFLRRSQIRGIWKGIVVTATLLGPVAVLMSYSRGPILGFILICLAALLVNRKRFARALFVNVALVALAIAAVGVNSSMFFFDRLQNRTEAMFSNTYEDPREAERIYAYSQPFSHLAEHPEFVGYGEGNGITKSGGNAEVAGQASHALFAAAYYAYGMVAAILYHVLIAMGLLFAWRARNARAPGFAGSLTEASFLSMIAILPWAAFAHSIVSEPRGAMLFFAALGLVAATRNLNAIPKPKDRRPGGPSKTTLGHYVSQRSGAQP